MSNATTETERPLGRGPLPWRRARVAATLRETASAVTLELDVPGWPGHLAGQHVDVRLTAPDGYQAQRSYSIASAPEEGMRLRLTVERFADGEVSPYLADELQAGDELELRGPIGGWFVWRVGDGGPLLLVAGGSGLVPLMAMLRHRSAARSDAAARVLVSSRGPQNDLFAAELDEQGTAGVEVVRTYTRAPPPGWRGASGRVDRELLAGAAYEPGERPRIFVCGPTGFVETVATALVDLGHDAARVKTERFGPTGG